MTAFLRTKHEAIYFLEATQDVLISTVSSLQSSNIYTNPLVRTMNKIKISILVAFPQS